MKAKLFWSAYKLTALATKIIVVSSVLGTASCKAERAQSSNFEVFRINGDAALGEECPILVGKSRLVCRRDVDALLPFASETTFENLGPVIVGIDGIRCQEDVCAATKNGSHYLADPKPRFIRHLNASEYFVVFQMSDQTSYLLFRMHEKGAYVLAYGRWTSRNKADLMRALGEHEKAGRER